MHRPIRRSKLRLWAGKWWYTGRRYWQWLSDRSVIVARRKERDKLPFIHMQHETPYVRQLRHVEQWLHRNKIVNLRLAARQLDGLLLQPGETFSYWRTIGKPTKRKGYVQGMVLFYGSYKTGIGGGLCQLSNLIYWMTLHTPLTVTERHRHSYDVFPDAGRTQPFGSGATCAYNYLDLQVRNDTSHTYQLCISAGEHTLKGEWRSEGPPAYRYEIYEREHRILSQPWGGYVRRNVIARRIRNQDHELIDDEYVTGNEALMMYAPMLGEEEEEAAGGISD